MREERERREGVMDNTQRKAEMTELANTLGLSDEEAIFAIRAATEFKGHRAQVCTYVAALVSHVADIAEEKGVG